MKLGRSALEPLDHLPTLERIYDLQGSWTTAFEHRPDLHQLIIDLEQLGLTEKLRYNATFPDAGSDRIVWIQRRPGFVARRVCGPGGFQQTELGRSGWTRVFPLAIAPRGRICGRRA